MKPLISRFEIPAKNFKGAVKFYETILNQKLHKMIDPNWDDMMMFTDPNKKDAMSWAIYGWEKANPWKYWVTIYLRVDGELDEVLSRIEWAWWKITMDKLLIGEWWAIAQFEDTEWNIIWLHSATA